MNFLYPQYCNDPAYVQKELSDEEFFSLLKPDNKIKEYADCKDYDGAWNEYLNCVCSTLDKRTFYRLSDTEDIKNYINKYFTKEEKENALKFANNLTNYIFKLVDDEPFTFSKGNVPWNSDLGNSVYNQLYLTYMGYLNHLGPAYMLTGDSKYPIFFADLINSLADTCPVPRGDDFARETSTWTRLGVALRLASILNNMCAMFNDAEFDVQIKKRIIKYMFLTARYVRKYHAANGNHVVVQMTSLICAAAFFEEFTEADDWLSYAVARIEKELDESVYSDGVQAEGSPNYHSFVLNELVMLKALQLNGFDKIPNSLEDKMHNMFIAIRDMCTPGGDLLNLGDTSTGVSALKTLKLAQGLYPDEFNDMGDVKLPLMTIFKFGKTLTEGKDGAEVTLPKMAVYKESGFLSYRNDFTENADFMFMHAGEGINGHAHADSLSTILYSRGRNILLDSGNAPYEWDEERKYTLSTAAHSTIKVDNEDSHVRMLHWLPMRTAPCKVWVCEETDDYVLFFASHYGYHRFPDPVVHTRKLIYVKDGGYFIILDLMNAEEEHDYEAFFHLPPSEYEFNEITKCVHTKFDEANVMLYPIYTDGNNFDIINTKFHPNHNSKLDKPTYKITSKANGNKCFMTLVIPFDKEVPQVSFSPLHAKSNGEELSEFESSVVQLEINKKKTIIAINNISIDPTEYVNWTGNPNSDAHMKSKVNSKAISVNGEEFKNEVKIIK